MNASPDPSLRLRTITDVWWPLAASWLFMAFELPIIGAVLARLPEPRVQLAAFGGIVYPLLLLIESPVIMLLAASTALSRDWSSYSSLRRYMQQMSAALTVIHVLLVATPLYFVVTRSIIGAPEPIIGPSRWALAVAVPWTWAIANRRFQQGVLIRHGATRVVGVGTFLRISTMCAVLVAGVTLATAVPSLAVPGVALGAAGVVAGVLAEMLWIRARTRPVLEEHYTSGAAVNRPLELTAFLAFYVPLALTSLLSLAVQPIGAAAISRMPEALLSLAGWPIVIGLIFVLRSGGTAYKEVVVAMLDRPDPWPALRAFTLRLTLAIFGATLLVAWTPLARLWLGEVSGLGPELTELTRLALALAVLIPVSGVLQNWYIGILVHAHRTRAVTWSMLAFLAVTGTVLGVGVAWQGSPGLYVALLAFTAGNLAQLAWARYAARDLLL